MCKEEQLLDVDRVAQTEPLNLLGVDTILFDYGGVVGTHRIEPYWGQLSALLECDPKKTREFLSEETPHGSAFRQGHISMEEFWDEVQRLAGVSGKNPRQLMDNWARSYTVDPRMIDVSERLRSRGYRTGILMNSDAERFRYIDKTYHLGRHFNFLISSCTHKITKPEPQAYEVAKEVVGRSDNPSAILYIDDKEKYVQVAIGLGVQGYTFESYENLVSWLAQKEILEG